ncbi:MAG: hypothetical protein KGJ13_03965 [Patescibacteria group bacterium]|nr:hypothetical protein [Patescibacteria group bacterium]
MTFIHSNNRKNLAAKLIIFLMIALFTGTAGLIVLYNKIVDLNHALADNKAQLESIGLQSTQLQNRIVALTGGGGTESIARADGLVLDQNPQYLPVAAPAPQAVAVK